MLKVVTAVCHTNDIEFDFFKSFHHMSKCFPDVLLNDIFVGGSLVGHSRHTAARLFYEKFSKDADYLLFLDTDMDFTPDLFQNMYETLDGKDIYGALYFSRKPNYFPTCFTKVSKAECTPIDFETVHSGKIVPVQGMGMGFTFIHKSVIQKMFEKKERWFDLYPLKEHGEDINFCQSAIKNGFRCFVNTSQICGHVMYVPVGISMYDVYHKKEEGKQNG